MTQTYARPLWTALILLGLAALEFGLATGAGRVLVTTFEVDTLHYLDGIERTRMGQAPHIDFRTPLGALTFEAMAVWDAPPGRAIALANGTVAAIAALLAAWLAATRLSFVAALALGAFATLLASSLMVDDTGLGSTLALSYNRWGWAAMVVVAPIMALAPRRLGAAVDWGDALALGLTGALVAFLKISFVAALGPMWLGWLLLGGRPRAALLSLVVALAGMAALAAALGGAGATAAYAADLWDVATSEVRPQPGASFWGIVSSPVAAPLMLCALVAALALLRGGLRREALSVALYVLGVALAAWQNWGNDLTGLLALPFLLLALAPRLPEEAKVLGRSGRRALETIAVVLLVWAAPIAVNAQRSLLLAYIDRPEMIALAPQAASDLVWHAPESGPRVISPLHPERAQEPVAIAGETLPPCSLHRHYVMMLSEAAETVREDPRMAGRRMLAMDLTNALWLLVDGAPLSGVYIWVYGESGDALRQAEVLAVPLCPSNAKARDGMIEETEALGLELRVIRRTPGWLFLENLSATAG
ncbi:hypothetical protein [Albimonas pacifica]|uniref:4-amino-4-deoxy-L-arabinose transferase n=1 Tax=Albimonas pacifica TaxID=1114924 RepID=A0A1I3PTW2_9RHOB|nr:hypothetical protein [Albimonas pacifica]SFJ25068.1 hypothetical protein SAMN05216258_1219 [Albimonas pacifica]